MRVVERVRPDKKASTCNLMSPRGHKRVPAFPKLAPEFPKLAPEFPKLCLAFPKLCLAFKDKSPQWLNDSDSPAYLPDPAGEAAAAPGAAAEGVAEGVAGG